uniref:purine-nucleoside phosphorylase n=1 Tax=Fundulus heteroclitus TaxID=8078 RepID=A0A3Q2QB19_FUNHE
TEQDIWNTGVWECRKYQKITCMSTIHEVIVARHAGMRCFAMSLITNRAVMDYDSQERANHDEVLETGRQRAKQMEVLVSTMVARLKDDQNDDANSDANNDRNKS